MRIGFIRSKEIRSCDRKDLINVLLNMMASTDEGVIELMITNNKDLYNFCTKFRELPYVYKHVDITIVMKESEYEVTGGKAKATKGNMSPTEYILLNSDKILVIGEDYPMPVTHIYEYDDVVVVKSRK